MSLPTKKSRRLSVILRLILLIAIIAIGAAFFVLLPEGAITEAMEWIRRLGPWGPVVLALIYIPESMLMIPGFVLTLGAGYFFGVFSGTVAASLGSVTGATIAFLIGRTLGRGFVERRMANHPKFAAIDRAVAKSGFKIVLLIRLSPIIPFSVTNYLFGLTRVRLVDYVLASWIGMFPMTLVYAYLGYLGRKAQSFRDITKAHGNNTVLQSVMLVLGLVITLILTVYVTRIAQRALKQTIGDDEHSVESA